MRAFHCKNNCTDEYVGTLGMFLMPDLNYKALFKELLTNRTWAVMMVLESWGIQLGKCQQVTWFFWNVTFSGAFLPIGVGSMEPGPGGILTIAFNYDPSLRCAHSAKPKDPGVNAGTQTCSDKWPHPLLKPLWQHRTHLPDSAGEHKDAANMRKRRCATLTEHCLCRSLIIQTIGGHRCSLQNAGSWQSLIDSRTSSCFSFNVGKKSCVSSRQEWWPGATHSIGLLLHFCRVTFYGPFHTKRLTIRIKGERQFAYGGPRWLPVIWDRHALCYCWILFSRLL